MILITGGAGYIGSHFALALFQKPLIEKEKEIVILDNLSTGHIETIETLRQFGTVHFEKADLTNLNEVNNVFSKYNIDKVVHFAAFAQVAESIANPQKYYYNNIVGSINLLNAMLSHNVKKIVFSSTAKTYGEAIYTPIDEKHPQSPKNPYGKTKLAIEQIMKDYSRAYDLRSVRLRYFNVIGADSNQIIGEWHTPESHLIPNILKSVINKDKRTFELYGDDYDTKDGTAIRDFINVEDLTRAHLLALNYLDNGGKTDFVNIGSNGGYSVKEVLNTCELITETKIPYVIKPKREGDHKILLANNKKAKQILNWEPQTSLEDSISSAYLWEQKLDSLLKTPV